MCGIFCVARHDGSTKLCSEMYDLCCCLLNSRGPDFQNSLVVNCEGITVLFGSSVLWTQGENICKQPLLDLYGNVLLWNGDIYDGLIMETKSDTELLLEMFVKEGVVNTLCRVKGPYSFIYYNKNSKRIWFGRDSLGRVSLLWSFSTSSLVLTSVSSPLVPIEEVPPLGIFSFNLETFELTVRPWYHQSEVHYSISEAIKIGEVINYEDLSSIRSSRNTKHPNESDLMYIKEFTEGDKNVSSFYNSLLLNIKGFQGCVERLNKLLDEAISLRCSVRPPYCQDCKPKQLANCNHPKLGILFSGGLDSTLLALLADKHVPSNEAIDLFNVAFEKSSPSGPFNAPDRQTGLSSLLELQTLAPNRTWNFVKVDVTREDLDTLRHSRINKLIYPLKSILDDSLGCALWFAASGKGILNSQPFVSTATVLLLGMGADEMFGGYRKARRAWMNEGWSGLAEELVNGLINLPIRNLGRDNRIVSDHSRVPRFPFLDETVVAFAYSLSPWQKCYLGKELPEGVGDKLLLRLLAWKLGLKKAAFLPKRALQFGSRVANSKEIGHDVSVKLLKSWDSLKI